MSHFSLFKSWDAEVCNFTKAVSKGLDCIPTTVFSIAVFSISKHICNDNICLFYNNGLLVYFWQSFKYHHHHFQRFTISWSLPQISNVEMELLNNPTKLQLVFDNVLFYVHCKFYIQRKHFWTQLKPFIANITKVCSEHW